MRWNQITPRGKLVGETPTPGRMKTKWDETPVRNNMNGNIPQTPNSVFGQTPTPQGAFNLPTPSPGVIKNIFNFLFILDYAFRSNSSWNNRIRDEFIEIRQGY